MAPPDHRQDAVDVVKEGAEGPGPARRAVPVVRGIDEVGSVIDRVDEQAGVAQRGSRIVRRSPENGSEVS
jgi:hypothetical protein